MFSTFVAVFFFPGRLCSQYKRSSIYRGVNEWFIDLYTHRDLNVFSSSFLRFFSFITILNDKKSIQVVSSGVFTPASEIHHNNTDPYSYTPKTSTRYGKIRGHFNFVNQTFGNQSLLFPLRSSRSSMFS